MNESMVAQNSKVRTLLPKIAEKPAETEPLGASKPSSALPAATSGSRRASMPHPGMREMAAHATMKRNTACVGATSAIAPPAIGPMTIARLPVNVTSALIRLSSSRSAVKYAGNARGTVSAIPQVMPKTAAPRNTPAMLVPTT